MPAQEEWLDRPIMITPRSLATMALAVVTGVFSGYLWLFSTFTPLLAFEAHASQFSNHVEAATIWQLEARMEDLSDKRRLQAQRLKEPGGDTPDNRRFYDDLEKREKKVSRQISCLQSNGSHCLRTDNG